MTTRRPSLLLYVLLALSLEFAAAKQYNFACDPVPGAASYTVYVVSNGTTNTTTFSTNVFPNVNVPWMGSAYCTETDTNGFESENSVTLIYTAIPPTGFKKK